MDQEILKTKSQAADMSYQALIEQQLARMGRQEFIRKYGAAILLAVLFVYNAIFTNNFLTVQTMFNLVVQSSPMMIVALGMTFVIATKGIDISVGASMAMGGMVTSISMFNIGLVPGIILGVITASMIGVANGVSVAYFGVQPIIVTLAMMIGARGLAQMLTPGGLFFFPASEPLTKLAIFFIGPLPVQFVYLVVFFVVFAFIAFKTSFGRHIEAIGDNLQASRLCGIKTERNLVLVYTMSAALAGFAGILVSARTAACDGYSIGAGIEMDAIACVVIGGTSLMGGKPQVIGTVIGAFIMQVIYSMVIMNNLSYDWAMVVKALVIILAVVIQRERSRT